MNDAFLGSTVVISYQLSPDKKMTGSGFFVFRPIDKDKGLVFLITNKHVLPPEGVVKSIKIRVRVGPPEAPHIQWVEIPIVGNDGHYLNTVKRHPDNKYDIAVVNVTEAITKFGIQATWISTDLFCTTKILIDEKISIGDEIFILGYPASIYEEKNISPILRTGVISSVPSEGYNFNKSLRDEFSLPDHLDGFLIDANIFPGSSGSVVILKPQPATIGPTGSLVLSSMKKTPYVLGIVSHSIPFADKVLGNVQRIGLGVVFSADAIRSVIELFFQ